MATDIEKVMDSEEAFPELTGLERRSRALYREAKDVKAQIKSFVDTADAQITAANAAATAAAAMPAGAAKDAAVADAAAALALANDYKAAAVSARQAWSKRFL